MVMPQSQIDKYRSGFDLYDQQRSFGRAEDLNTEYWNRRGRELDDNRIVAAMEEHLRTAPQDFGRG
jgi:hypothetical protein